MAPNTLPWVSYKLQMPIDNLVELAANADQHYKPFWKKFKNGKSRFLEPADKKLRAVLDRIRTEILLPVPLSPIVHGCVKDHSPLTNAGVLVKSLNLANVDVKDCFPKMTNRMVYRTFREIVGVGPEVARLLTRLTTRCGHLPQGATTSDGLANLVLTPVDRLVEKIAGELGLEATRYVDNYYFKGARAREAIGPTIAALQGYGLAVRHKKTFNAGPRNAHIATGLATNGYRPTVRRNARDAARDEVYRVISRRMRGADTSKQERSLRGRLIHISQTNPSFAARMKAQLQLAGIHL